MWSKILNCFNNQKDGQEKTSEWAKKINYGNWLYLCLLGNNSAVIKRTTLKGDIKKHIMDACLKAEQKLWQNWFILINCFCLMLEVITISHIVLFLWLLLAATFLGLCLNFDIVDVVSYFKLKAWCIFFLSPLRKKHLAMKIERP